MLQEGNFADGPKEPEKIKGDREITETGENISETLKMPLSVLEEGIQGYC
jgi:hypothetical protein